MKKQITLTLALFFSACGVEESADKHQQKGDPESKSTLTSIQSKNLRFSVPIENASLFSEHASEGDTFQTFEPKDSESADFGVRDLKILIQQSESQGSERNLVSSVGEFVESARYNSFPEVAVDHTYLGISKGTRLTWRDDQDNIMFLKTVSATREVLVRAKFERGEQFSSDQEAKFTALLNQIYLSIEWVTP